MWIVIDIPGLAPEYAIIAMDEEGHNLLFDTIDLANEWGKENCVWNWKVVEI